MHWFNHSKLFDLARQGQRLTHIAAVIPLSFVFALVGPKRPFKKIYSE